MARPLNTQPKTYDETKLASMLPPFNIRIEKIKGSTKMPIPMPEGEDGAPPGTGWGIEDVRGIEQWIVTEWAGGGLYEVSVTDSSPQPQTLKWQPFWDPKLFPEKTPPPLVDAASAMAPPPPTPISIVSQPQQQAGRFMPSAFPNGLPQGGFFGGASSPYPQQQQHNGYYQQPPMPNAPMPGTFQWEAYQREVERREQANREREREADFKRLTELKEKTERDAISAKHVAELERERLANEQRFQAQANQMNELRAMITGLTSAIKEGASSSKVSPEIEAMREAQRQTEAKLDRERTEREAERRDATLKESLRQAQEATQRQIEMMQRQLDDRTRAMEAAATAAAAAAANKSPDQMLMMFQNSQREQMELAKELSRNQLAQMTQMQTFMMNPRDMMAMAQESTKGIDQATDRVGTMFGRIIDTQQKVTENLLQMQPGSNSVVELVGTGMDRIGSLAERYLGGKQLEAQLNQQSQVQVAEAQARAYAQTVIAAQQTEAARAAPAQLAPAAGLGNPQPAQPQTNGVSNGAKKKKTKAVIVVDETKRLGRTDAEWFGPLLTNVQELRVNAHKFIESLSMDPPRLNKQGNPDGTDPDTASQILLQAISMVAQRQLAIPVMTDLLFQDRFADFVDVLLPDPIVTQPYRDDVVQNITRAARIAQGLPAEGPVVDHSEGADDDDDDDENEDDEDEHDEPNDDQAQDGASVTPILTIPPKKPAPTSSPRRA